MACASRPPRRPSRIQRDIVQRTMQVHGSLGALHEMVLGEMWIYAASKGLVDGLAGVHKVTVAKNLLKHYQPAPGLIPIEHPISRGLLLEKLKDYLRKLSRRKIARLALVFAVVRIMKFRLTGRESFENIMRQ
ncbi:hypothetical protein [Pseudomonas sp. PDM31]|uniref:hypothetical protein n=1 Tax=Pseudomonas sp. PDM31 TaxID=2854778 RepID=UPI001C4601FD|nr:hypothetical protein [Pseudomonas sp. PDM31]MBV7477572.1 hypothetical protein [Pseudomonas sp. PDM31]